MNLNLDMKSAKALVATLDRISTNMRNPGPVIVLIGRYLQTATARRWRKCVSPDGVPWKPTGRLARMSRPGGGGRGKTLWSNGALFKSVTSRVPQQGQVFRAEKTTMTMGTSIFYAHVHQEGMTIYPRQSKRLAVPMNRQAALAGGARKWWAGQVAAGVTPFIGGKGKFIATSGKNRTTLQFALFRSVTIPPRPFLGIAREDHDPMANLVAGYMLRKGVIPDASGI